LILIYKTSAQLENEITPSIHIVLSNQKVGVNSSEFFILYPPKITTGIVPSIIREMKSASFGITVSPACASGRKVKRIVAVMRKICLFMIFSLSLRCLIV